MYLGHLFVTKSQCSRSNLLLKVWLWEASDSDETDYLHVIKEGAWPERHEAEGIAWFSAMYSPQAQDTQFIGTSFE